LRERLEAILALPPERRAALGEAARRAVEHRWSWKVVAARLLSPRQLDGALQMRK
jgi:glycosyltransferase involved in cell wall biosynthesis